MRDRGDTRIVGPEACGTKLMQFVKNLDLIVEKLVTLSEATQKRWNDASTVRAI
jgi:hypothetical protein